MPKHRLVVTLLVLLLLEIGCDRAADSSGDDISPPEPAAELIPAQAAGAATPQSDTEPEAEPADRSVQAPGSGETADPNLPDFVAARPIEDPAAVEPSLGLVEGFHRALLVMAATAALSGGIAFWGLAKSEAR